MVIGSIEEGSPSDFQPMWNFNYSLTSDLSLTQRFHESRPGYDLCWQTSQECYMISATSFHHWLLAVFQNTCYDMGRLAVYDSFYFKKVIMMAFIFTESCKLKWKYLTVLLKAIRKKDHINLSKQWSCKGRTGFFISVF